MNGDRICELCEATYSLDDDVPDSVADDGREERFCPACRCDLVEGWPSEEPEWEKRELREIAEWRKNRELASSAGESGEAAA